MTKRIIVIGGVAGGASFATRLRRLDEQAEIVIYEASPHVSFANCGLPYYIGGTIQNRAQLLVKSVEDMHADFNIEVHVNHQVIHIDPIEKKIQIQAKNEADIQVDHYDTLILATGVQPIQPEFSGLADANNVFTLRTIPDVDQITDYIEANGSENKHAVVVGGGFIGLEMAENLQQRGYHVTIVEAADQVMTSMDFEMAQYLHEHLQERGVQLMFQKKVVGFEEAGHKVVLDSGKKLSADLVILAIGVHPNTKWLQDVGIKTNQRGFVQVDDHFETSQQDIYAIGDVISVTNQVTQQEQSLPLAGPANRQGRLLADILSGISRKKPQAMGTAVVKVFELTAASTGVNERQLKSAGIAYQVIHLHPSSHATYYPGATEIELKVLFSSEDGRLLGAQGIGRAGVDKRIDMIATALHFGATISDLIDIEVAYAPPYASAKDPVNFAGYLGTDVQEGLVRTIQWWQVNDLVASGAMFLDVRNPIELMALPKIKTAINIPRSEIRQRVQELPKDQPIYVYCSVGLRGYNVCRTLSQLGYEVYNLDGGLKTYAMSQYTTKA